MQNSAEQQQPAPKLQIYPTSNTGVSPFWREKYEKDARKYWDIFYKKHQDKFFKDRHYLDKEWDRYFSVEGNKVILEVGCGVGNTVFPLIATYPDIFIYACDFSQRAVSLVKAHKEFSETRVSAFVCDLTVDDLTKDVPPSSLDIVTLIFVLSAVSPEKMPLVLQNLRKVLKPNGHVLFRDYAVGDLAQERLTVKDQKISENFFVRGDGTRAFYFSNDFLSNLFKENGFDVEELDVCCKQVENRSRELVMNRRWVQAVFRCSENSNPATKAAVSAELDISEPEATKPKDEKKASMEGMNNFDVDISEGVAMEMFGASPTNREILDVKLKASDFKIKLLSKEYQHTCKSTGLMLWESAYLMASVLERNPNIVSGKRVLEIGCGCAGICSMVAVRSADLVVATDGDSNALELLTENIATNLEPPLMSKLKTGKLEWGNKDQTEAIRVLAGGDFDVIIGTDVTYVAEAILPLFETARTLISSEKKIVEDQKQPMLILCHIFRRVDEPSLVSAASRFGFRLVDKWPTRIQERPHGNIISSWFSEDSQEQIPNSALNILCFQLGYQA